MKKITGSAVGILLLLTLFTATIAVSTAFSAGVIKILLPIRNHNMNEKTPIINLSFRANQRWVVMMAFIWAIFMLPGDIAYALQNEGLRLALTLMGIVAFIILFEIKIRKLTGGLSMTDFRKANPEVSYPWALLLGICAWHLFFRMWTTALLGVMNLEEMFGGMGGTV